MTPDVLLGPWPGVPELDRRSIIASIQAIADREALAITSSGIASLSRKPIVDVFAARRDGDVLVVRLFYDFRVSYWAQSGSDWDEHHFHVVEAVCRGGSVASHTIAKDFDNIRELDCDSYDAESASRKRRAAAVAEFWNEWLSLPFPFPGDPRPQ